MSLKRKTNKSPWRFVFLAMAIISSTVLTVDYLLPRLLLHSLDRNAMSIGIIGGADGPTTILVSTNPGSIWTQLIPLITLLVGIAGFLLLRSHKSQNNKEEGEA